MQNKRGQVTLFIIIAVVIVAVVVLFLVFRGREMPVDFAKPTEPGAYFADCIKPALEPSVEKIAGQGGYLELGNCIFYENICRHYLCYSTESYSACVNQEPLLKESIEEQLKSKLKQEKIVEECIADYAEQIKKTGYDISTCLEAKGDAKGPEFNVSLTQKKISVPLECDIIISKGEEVLRFKKFEPVLEWPLLDFVLLTDKIIDEEITNTDFDPVSYMLSHYWVEIEKFRTGDGSEIYTLKERATGREFGFAIRNYILPGGLL